VHIRPTGPSALISDEQPDSVLNQDTLTTRWTDKGIPVACLFFIAALVDSCFNF